MNRRLFLKKIAIGAAGIGFSSLPVPLIAGDNLVTITILHTNDLHSQIEPFTGTAGVEGKRGGMAYIATLVQKFRDENPETLLFDSGDMFQGTPYFNYFQGEPILKLMSAAGYNAGTIGNHEFDNGLEGILESLPFAKFPLINSNYDFSDTILAGKFPRWKTFKRDGVKIGVYALGIELKGLIASKNYGNIVYLDPLMIASEMESFLKNEKKCELVICLSHLGLRYNYKKVSDVVLASNTSMTDLILGGHTHTNLEKPLLVKNAVGNEIIVNQAAWGGQVLGKIDFIFERVRKGKMSVKSENINS